MQTIEIRKSLAEIYSENPEIQDFFKGTHSVVIASHKNPDGDAIGSCLGLALCLNAAGFESTVVLPDPVPDSLKWLPGYEKVLTHTHHAKQIKEAVSKADGLLLLDLSGGDRLGALEGDLLPFSGFSLLIDHHPGQGGFTEYAVIAAQFGSTAELLYHFLDSLCFDAHITDSVATCLLTGIITDTLGLRVASSYPEVFQVVMNLMSKGADKDRIYDEVYNQFNESRLRLLGFALDSRLQLIHNKRFAYIYLTKGDFTRFDHKKGDTEGFVNYPLGVKGIDVSVLLTEQDGFVKLSFRSRGRIDVNQLARKYFNGGGHALAAGGKYFGTMDESRTFLEQIIATEL